MLINFSSGNYIISGGTETVLVIWQLDTGHKQYLPHLSATIQDVVVSPSGSSYAVQLADNSAMIISTAELIPTTNIAGIQASVMADKDAAIPDVSRIHEETWRQRLIQRTAALINPLSPSKLLLAVGQTQEIDPVHPLVMGSPYMQTFDLGSSHSSSRQALCRSNITSINTAPNAQSISEPRVTHMKISHDGRWLATVDEWTPPAHDFTFLGSDKQAVKKERLSRREVFLKFWERGEDEDTWRLISRVDAPHTLSQKSSYAGRILDLAVDPEAARFVTIGEDGIFCTWTPRMRKRDGVPVRGPKGQILRNWTCQYAVALGKEELLEETGHLDTPVTSACVAFSEDGSVVAVASSSQEGVVNLVDPNSGSIRQSQSGLFQGYLAKMEFLGQDLIILADQLAIYDLISNEVRQNLRLSNHFVRLSDDQKQQMVHLAVDVKSRTFAVALPVRRQDMTFQQSEIFVFHQDEMEPQLVEVLPSFVTALIPSVDSEGFLVLDTSAEIRTAHKKGSQFITTMAKSTSALQLEDPAPESQSVIVPLADEEEEEEPEDVQLLTPAATEDGNEEDDENDTPVVTSQQLAEVFDIGPSFALPPLEEMFYQVAELFASKPLAPSVS